MNNLILTADLMTAHNTFDCPDRVRPTLFDGASINGEGDLMISMPAMSVVVLKLEA